MDGISLNSILRLDFTPEALLISNFCIGLILGPTSFGFLYYIMFVLIFEIILALVTQGGRKNPLGSIEFRVFYVAAGLFGWIFGRTVNSSVLDFQTSELPIQNVE